VAGIDESGATGEAGGLMGARARVQYAAMGSLRWHMFVNSLRNKQSALELGARTFTFALYGAGGLALGVGAAVATAALAGDGDWDYLPVLFWVVFLIWQVVPVMLASFQEQFDMGILLRFPLRFSSYCLLFVVFGLADISTILGTLCCLGILTGITLTRPDLFGWTLLGLAIFAAFNILLVRAIFAWIDRWLAQRKTREILGAVFMVAVLSLQLLNPALRQNTRRGPQSVHDRAQRYRRRETILNERYGPWMSSIEAVQKWLPPGLAAAALQLAAEQQPESGMESLSLLGIYFLAAGGVLGARLRREYRGENLGQAPSRAKEKRHRGRWLLDRAGWSGGPIAAVVEKEVRTLLRTLPLIYALGAPLLLVIVFSTVFARGSGHDGQVFPPALPICMVYSQLGFTQIFYNNLGAEGAGIQLYFLSPTPIRTVILAKNLFHSVLFGLVALSAGVLTSLRLGAPNGEIVAATAAWLIFALPSNLAAGNIFSLTMPYRLNPGRIARQRGSQANALLGLMVQISIMAIGALVFTASWYLGKIWLTVPIFLALAVGAVAVWMRTLRNADGMANQRRDTMIATVMKV
jgi:ABC-2 type transport system permease protein